MILVRRFVGVVLSLVLFVALIVWTDAVNFQYNLSKPDKIESWLQESNLYGHFVKNAISGSEVSIGTTGPLSSISLSDSAVQQAAQSAFPPSLVQQDINQFLDSNYAWLQGKTSSPEFRIDLTKEKQSFAQQVGEYVQGYFSTLPICTKAQLAKLKQVDPLDASCRPANVTPVEEGAIVTDKIARSTSFLSKPVLTAATLNPQKNGSQPYSQHLSNLPKVYRGVKHLIWTAPIVAVLAAVGILFVAPRKRRGLRRIAEVFIVAGALLLFVKLVSDAVAKHIEQHVFNNNDVGQLQQSLTGFVHRAETALTKIDLYVGLAFVIIGLIVFVYLTSHRESTQPARIATEPIDDAPTTPAPPATAASPTTPVATTASTATAPKPTAPTTRKRPPRLIQ
ncbi:MAG TPA: hypothetical protein VG992_04485 [Candidatus Saccharimonadales bacterium]|nr:hypothetical protein [Candidatus Saccharimonadales bacterium]